MHLFLVVPLLMLRCSSKFQCFWSPAFCGLGGSNGSRPRESRFDSEPDLCSPGHVPFVFHQKKFQCVCVISITILSSANFQISREYIKLGKSHFSCISLIERVQFDFEPMVGLSLVLVRSLTNSCFSMVRENVTHLLF